VALAKQAGEALSEEDQVQWSKLTAEQRAPYEGKAAAKNAEKELVAGGGAAGASGGDAASAESSDGEEAKEDKEGSDGEEDEEGEEDEDGEAAATQAPVDADMVFTADDLVQLTQTAAMD
jgi:hypothetical protein